MSTKVISAKISSEDYDKLLDECNSKGCSISDHIRERCLVPFAESNESNFEQENAEVSRLVQENLRLQLELSSKTDQITRKDKQLEEFTGLFSQEEIKQRRICCLFKNH